MKVVVGGGSGYVGRALVESLRADGHDVTRRLAHARRWRGLLGRCREGGRRIGRSREPRGDLDREHPLDGRPQEVDPREPRDDDPHARAGDRGGEAATRSVRLGVRHRLRREHGRHGRRRALASGELVPGACLRRVGARGGEGAGPARRSPDVARDRAGCRRRHG